MTRCTKCSKMFSQRLIELDADYKVVCPECYLEDIPAEDVYCALIDLEFAERGTSISRASPEAIAEKLLDPTGKRDGAAA